MRGVASLAVAANVGFVVDAGFHDAVAAVGDGDDDAKERKKLLLSFSYSFLSRQRGVFGR